MKQLLVYAIGFLLITNLQAQQLKGVIVNENGVPIPNSTVYIQETAKGIAAGSRGEFQTALAPGSYTLEFRSMGYESIVKSILMEEQDQSVRIVLRESTFMLDEVVVYASDEDPALRIMRKAIAYAPYYRYQVKDYHSEAYIKGSLTVHNIPRILRRGMKVNSSDIDIDDLIGKPLIMESQSNIHFSSPETYNQNVVALKSSIPKEFNINQGLSIMTSSIYNPELDGRISPLSPGAFRYYDFKLENVVYQSDYIINNIKVTPRKKNPKLFSGYLYIMENSWNVYIADIVASELGTTMHYRINYHQVKPNVYLPTTYDVTLSLNTLGVKASGNYYASMKYNSVEVEENQLPEVEGTGNPEVEGTQNSEVEEIQHSDVIKGIVLPDSQLADSQLADSQNEEQLSLKQQKAALELEKLSQKDQLTTKEAYKMSKLINRMVEPLEVKEQRESLEIKDIEQVKMEVDSLAWRKDSTFWTNIRELPLLEEEYKSYQWRDSLSGNDNDAKSDEGNGTVLSIESNPKTIGGKIIQGGLWQMSRNVSLSYNGLMGALKEYNFVDGFWLGQTVSLNYAIDNNRAFSFSPSLYYTTAREEWLWNVAASLNFAPMSLGQFDFSAGHISRDVNSMNGESKLMNTLTTLGLGQNFIRFYDSQYAKANFSIDIANGLNFFTSAEIDKRLPLNNQTSFNFIDKEVSPNIPSSNFPSEADIYSPHKAANMMLGLTYTPRYRYRVREGRKFYAYSNYPTFSVAYNKGMNLFSDNQSPLYDKITLSISQNIKVSPFEEIDYHFSGGSFLSKEKLYINDLHYFRNNQMLITSYDFNRSFNLLQPYTASQSWWMEGHLNYQSQYLLIKNLPFLQHFLFDEAVHLHGLVTEERQLYLEFGYSIGFFGLGRAGIFTNLVDKKFEGVGLRVSYPLWVLFENPID